jgi:hypothetical protein
MLAAISATVLDRMAVVDRVVGALVTTAGLILVAALAGIVAFTAVRGTRPEAPELLPRLRRTGSDAPLDEGASSPRWAPSSRSPSR